MRITLMLTFALMVLLFLMIWIAAVFMPWRRLTDFFPQDIRENIPTRFLL